MKFTHFVIRMSLLLGVACGALLAERSVVAQEKSPKFSAADIEFFEKKIRPLLHKRCYSCHSTDAKKIRGGLRLDHRAGLLSGGDSGPAVVAGQVEKSLLIDSVRYGADSYQMPPAGKLPANEIALLEAWVKRGAPFPMSAGDNVTKPAGIDYAAGRKFWSFQPLKKVAPPTVPPGQRVRKRIDSFVLAELSKRKLQPSPEADRRTSIRRLSFDLTGLPPTPEEVDRFVADQSPQAYAKLVDRLLASPQYGERWARFWLDLARYTDATASWLDSTGQAYLYRDWVTQAFNEDIPYDQFVVRQLATDMLPETGPADTPALGLLGLSPTYWKELKLPMEIIKIIVADEWEERIDTVSRTFLGLTVACARCHDHKFDPISTEDYYAFAGVLASTRLAERPLISAADYKPVAAAKAEVKKLKAQLKKLRAKKPPAKDAAAQIAKLEQQIKQIKESTPHYSKPMANGLIEESMYVVRAGKTAQNGTRIEYKTEPRDLPMFIRGNPNKTGSIVPRRFLRVLSAGEPKPFQNGSGRLELARSIVGDAGPLAARVIVNRIWLAHFGRGLIETPSNFGSLGSRPSHPELLEDLTARFVENGWSLKWLHREIVLSATYRQSSASQTGNHQLDPDNRWLWRMNRGRLDIEAWRDAMLAVSGRLDDTIGGPSQSLASNTNRRRTLYGTINRREMPAMLSLHDFPDPTAHSARRITTTTSLQGLFVLNSPLMTTQAAALAARVQKTVPNDIPGQVQFAYGLLYGRPATEEDIALATAFLSTKTSTTKIAPWQMYAQVLLGSNEFLFVD
jgi:hypothetical protein